jgi:hypothetical protein
MEAVQLLTEKFTVETKHECIKIYITRQDIAQINMLSKRGQYNSTITFRQNALTKAKTSAKTSDELINEYTLKFESCHL